MPQDVQQQDLWKKLAGAEAAKLVENGMVIGLGTGSTSAYLVQAIAQRMRETGIRLVGAVPSSIATGELAASLDIPLTTLDEHPELDLYIDGADEIDPQLRLIKGAGGALLREKIVASSARRFVVIADISKKVELLGTHYPLPVEVVPLATTPVTRKLTALDAQVQLRHKNNQVFVTDNHNYILDCTFPEGIHNPEQLNAQLHTIVGIVETGLFLNMTRQVIIGGPAGVERLTLP
ncbi:MAG TPA: ribose-5-phosphate isomerase RpiA [Dictyobacter sp.]|jgi:ribose 5-phosphate isomerase A|nr:ribose-5-phosphate isomerase RpiA [Dictyobacter sp.]